MSIETGLLDLQEVRSVVLPITALMMTTSWTQWLMVIAFATLMEMELRSAEVRILAMLKVSSNTCDQDLLTVHHFPNFTFWFVSLHLWAGFCKQKLAKKTKQKLLAARQNKQLCFLFFCKSGSFFFSIFQHFCNLFQSM